MPYAKHVLPSSPKLSHPHTTLPSSMSTPSSPTILPSPLQSLDFTPADQHAYAESSVMIFPILNGFFFPPCPLPILSAPPCCPPWPALEPGGLEPPPTLSGASCIRVSPCPLDVPGAGAGGAALAYPLYSVAYGAGAGGGALYPPPLHEPPSLTGLCAPPGGGGGGYEL